MSTRTNKRVSHTFYSNEGHVSKTHSRERENRNRVTIHQGVQTLRPFTTRGLCDDGLPLESRARAVRVTHSVQSRFVTKPQ